MIVRLESVGRGAKWSILLVLGLAHFFNYPYVVTGESDADIVESESRSPYVYLSQREYLVQPDGNYEQVAILPEIEANATSSPPGTLRKYVNDLKRIQASASSEEEGTGSNRDLQGEGSTSQRFENQYTRYRFRINEEENEGQESNNKPSSIQDVLLDHKHGVVYGVPVMSGGGKNTAGSTGNAGYHQQPSASPSPSYDHISYQSPLQSYEVPTHYFPSEHYEWPATYSGHSAGPLPLSGFLGSVGDLTASVKHVKSQLGEQKAITAYKVADIVKNTGYAVNNAILTKGSTAAEVVGKTVYTAGEVLKNKGATATKLLQNTGHLASSAVHSAGHVGASLLRTKGEIIGSAIKTGAEVGTSVLGKTANALAGGTYLVKAKGDAASNLIYKGGRLASGIIGTKGRLISSVINTKGQFAAQIIEAKGKAAATLLESSGQKLTQLAEAIKSATAQKAKPPPYGWSEPSPDYSEPEHKEEEQHHQQTPKPQHDPKYQDDNDDHQQHQHQHQNQHHQYQNQQQQHQQPPAQLHIEDPPVHAHYQQNNYQAYSQDYANSYYDPRDTYSTRLHRREDSDHPKSEKVVLVESSEESPRTTSTASNLAQDDNDHDVSQDEDFQHDYSAYYPHHYSIRPHTDYYTRYRWAQ